ncbi:uncharacterized protein [Anoplolepis gracilipes]
MDSFICNKCFVPMRRGRQPYYITQCSHIFCQNCIQQVEERCPQCEYISPAYLSLEEPVMSKTIAYFAPITEIWDLLLKADALRSNQLQITMQRFREIEEKYEKLKKQFNIDLHNFKIVKEECMNLKQEKEKVCKKIQQIQNTRSMQNNSRSTSHMMTDFYPVSARSSDQRSASGSMDFLNFSNVTPQTDADGFRIPINNPRSANSIFTSDTGSNYSFRK